MNTNPGIYEILKDDSSIVAALGREDGTLRIYPWGEAPQNCPAPYVCYILIGGRPENLMGETPLEDTMGTQVDVWGRTGAEASEVMNLISNILEPLAHMTSFEQATRDPGTKLFQGRMDFDVIKRR